MNRKVIIIGSPGFSTIKGFLPGVEKDVANYYRFFKSPTGGAWDENEITTVVNPYANSLKAYLGNIECDYSIVVFSGHGAYFRRNQTTYLQANPYESISVNDLTTKAPKQLIIVDACRSFVESGLSGFLGEQLKSFSSRLSRAEAKRIYNSHLMKCEDGIIVCYSCSVGEYSTEDIDGGHFSSTILEVASNFAETSNKFSILPINTAFVRARKYLINYINNEQHPELRDYHSLGRIDWFPFAVKPAQITL